MPRARVEHRRRGVGEPVGREELVDPEGPSEPGLKEFLGGLVPRAVGLGDMESQRHAHVGVLGALGDGGFRPSRAEQVGAEHRLEAEVSESVVTGRDKLGVDGGARPRGDPSELVGEPSAAGEQGGRLRKAGAGVLVVVAHEDAGRESREVRVKGAPVNTGRHRPQVELPGGQAIAHYGCDSQGDLRDGGEGPIEPREALGSAQRRVAVRDVVIPHWFAHATARDYRRRARLHLVVGAQVLFVPEEQPGKPGPRLPSLPPFKRDAEIERPQGG